MGYGTLWLLQTYIAEWPFPPLRRIIKKGDWGTEDGEGGWQCEFVWESTCAGHCFSSVSEPFDVSKGDASSIKTRRQIAHELSISPYYNYTLYFHNVFYCTKPQQHASQFPPHTHTAITLRALTSYKSAWTPNGTPFIINQYGHRRASGVSSGKVQPQPQPVYKRTTSCPVLFCTSWLAGWLVGYFTGQRELSTEECNPSHLHLNVPPRWMLHITQIVRQVSLACACF